MNTRPLRLLLVVALPLAVAFTAMGCSGPTETPGDGGETVEMPAAQDETGRADEGDGDTDAAGEVGDGDDGAGGDSGDDDAGSAGAVPDSAGSDASADEDAEATEDLDAMAAPTSIVEPVTAITDTLTHADTAVGYAIDYPATWTIEAVPGSLVSLRSFDPQEYGHGGLMPGETRIDIVPDLSEAETPTLPELVAATLQAGSPLERREIELEGGVPAVLLRLSTSANMTGEAPVLLAVIGERGIRVQGYGQAELFESIARTLRPLE